MKSFVETVEAPIWLIWVEVLHPLINGFNKEAFLSCRTKQSQIIHLYPTILFLILDAPLSHFLIMKDYRQIQIYLAVKQENDYMSSGDNLNYMLTLNLAASLSSDMFSVYTVVNGLEISRNQCILVLKDLFSLKDLCDDELMSSESQSP